MQTAIERVSSNSSIEVIDWMGGDGTFAAKGNFASGTLVLEASIDGGLTWQPCKDASGSNLAFSADGIISFSIGPCKLRARMSGSTVVAGTLQVETLTATVDEVAPYGGYATVMVTCPSLFSPARVFRVYVPAGATRTEWMSRIYERLNASAELAPYFAVSQSATNTVVLTVLPPAAANDAALNISLSNTVSGVTSVTSSTNTTAGVAGTTNQVETLPVSGGVLLDSDIGVTVIGAGVRNSPRKFPVSLKAGMTAVQVASAIREALNHPDVTTAYDIGATVNSNVVLTTKSKLANDGTLNMALTQTPGLTEYVTATATAVGVAATPNVLVSLQKR